MAIGEWCLASRLWSVSLLVYYIVHCCTLCCVVCCCRWCCCCCCRCFFSSSVCVFGRCLIVARGILFYGCINVHTYTQYSRLYSFDTLSMCAYVYSIHIGARVCVDRVACICGKRQDVMYVMRFLIVLVSMVYEVNFDWFDCGDGRIWHGAFGCSGYRQPGFMRT